MCPAHLASAVKVDVKKNFLQQLLLQTTADDLSGKTRKNRLQQFFRNYLVITNS
jgi:hypothetical protein